MDRLNLLAIALGLAALAGINLYLTVFVTGLAIHFQWITLAPQYQSLAVLGQPWVMAVAGILYFLEFFADKIPWVDSIWDAVHTVIRPIGGALLAIQVLGHPNPAFTVVVALLGGGTSLISHTAKAATRLATNTSPEPFSNIALSFGEDIAVVAGLALIYHNPLVALAIFALGIAAFFYFGPKILRAIKVKSWLAWKKLNSPANVPDVTTLPTALPTRLLDIFNGQNVLGESIAWAVLCISGRGRGITANLSGALVALNEDPRKLFFIARKGRRRVAAKIDLEDKTVVHEPGFLSDNLSILPGNGKATGNTFIFPRSDAPLVAKVAEDLRLRISTPVWPLAQEHIEPKEQSATA